MLDIINEDSIEENILGNQSYAGGYTIWENFLKN
jgi:hypothetical protein